MKKLMLIAAGLSLCGCGSLQVTYTMPGGGQLTVKETTVLKKVTGGQGSVNKDGTITVGFSQSTGDVDLVNAVGALVLQAAAKGAVLADKAPAK